jgi:hypothetical protein
VIAIRPLASLTTILPSPYTIKRNILLAFVACTLAAFGTKPKTAGPKEETKYLAFQIFTNYTPDPHDAQALNNGMRERLTPGTAGLHAYVEDIKQPIGTVGHGQTRLAVMLSMVAKFHFS